MSYTQKVTHEANFNKPAPQRPRWLIPALAAVGILGVIAVAAVLFLSGQQPAFVPQVTGAPRAQIDQTKIDYGTVRLGQTIHTVFHIRNVGDHALEILNDPQVQVVKGCCPPQVKLTTHTVWPGQEATITLDFMMHEGMGGDHEFKIHLETNDPTQPQQDLTILSNWI